MAMNPRLLRPTPTGFNPKRVANLFTWWDFSDTASMAQNSDGTTAVAADGDPVGYVRDKSGTINLTQSTSNLRGSLTISGLGGRTSVYLSDTATSGWNFSPGEIRSFVNTIFIVARYTGTQDWTTFHNSGGLAFFDLAQASNASNAWISLDATPTYRVNGAAVAPTVTRGVLRTALGGPNAAYQLTVRGIDWADGITFNPAFQLGRYPSSVNFIGDFGEVLWYNRSLTDAEVTTVERYLKQKWKTP